MKTLFNLKSLFILTLVALGLSLAPVSSHADNFGSGGEIVILTTGDKVTFDYAFINFENLKYQDGQWGMPRRQTVIAKGEDITLHSSYQNYLSMGFAQEENGDIRVSFPQGIISKRNPDDGCDGGLFAKGCGASDPGEIYGIGFPNNLQERIFSDSPAFLQGEGMKVLFRASEGEALVPWSEENNYSPAMTFGSLIKIRVQDYPSAQVPGPHQTIDNNQELTKLDSNDYLKVRMAYNPEDPKNNGIVNADDQKITVYYLDGGVEKSEEFELGGGQDIRFYGPNANFVRAKASVGFPDAFDVSAESKNSAFTKLEYWTPGADGELKGTFNKGPVTRVEFFSYSGSFSYVRNNPAQNPGEAGLALDTKIESGDSHTLLQESAYLTLRTSAPKVEPAEGKLVLNPKGNGGDNGDANIPNFDPQKDPDLNLDDLNIVGLSGTGAPAIGGAGCSLGLVSSSATWWHLLGLFGLGLPLAVQRLRRK